MQSVSISTIKNDKADIEKLLRIALKFSETAGFPIFEMLLSHVTDDFIKDLEGKGFFIYRTPGNPQPIKTGPNTMIIPSIGVKGKLNDEAISYLKNKAIVNNFGFSILKIMLREKSKKEKLWHMRLGQPYLGKKSSLLLSTDRCLSCNIRMQDLQKLYLLARKEYDYALLFYPLGDTLYFDKKGPKMLPCIKEFSSIKEFIKAKKITTIQLTNFTKNELAKLGKRNFEKTILQLLKEHDAK